MLDRHLLPLFLAAATLLSFLPPFCNPALGHVVVQFLLLGAMSVSLNPPAALLVVAFAAPLGARLRSSTRFRRNQRVASGLGMIGLGAFVAFGEKYPGSTWVLPPGRHSKTPARAKRRITAM